MNLASNVSRATQFFDKAKDWLRSWGGERQVEPEASQPGAVRDSIPRDSIPRDTLPAAGLASLQGPSRESLDRLDQEGLEPVYSFDENGPEVMLEDDEEPDSLPIGEEMAQRMLRHATGGESNDEPIRGR